MKKRFLILVCSLFFFLAGKAMSAPLAGSYTIGGANPDFQDVMQAMDSASSLGVSGPVEFVIRPGIYSGLYNMYSIPGTGPDKKVIFRSENFDSSSVTITGLTNANQTVMLRLYQLEYVEFHHLGFALQNSPQNTATIGIIRGKYIGFYHCMVKGYPSSSASPDRLISGAPDTGLVVKNCYFAQAGGGLFVSNSSFSFRHALIENNFFDNLGTESIYVIGGAFTQIKNNVIISSGGGTTTGILMSGTSRYEISGNKIYCPYGTLNSCVVQLISSSGWPSQKSRIYNNLFFIQAGTTYIAYNFRSSSSSNLEIANNTFYMNGGLNAFVFYLQGAFSQGAEIDINNNIFYRRDSLASNYLLRIPNHLSYLPYVRSDYNVFYSHAPLFNSQYSSLSSYQLTGIETHSIYANPDFVSDTLLRFQNDSLEGIALPLPWVNADIEGMPRSPLQPDPGAYENVMPPVVSLGGDTAVCGSYSLSVSPNGSAVLWSNGSQSHSVTVFQSGWVWVTLSNSAGTAVDSVYITVLDTPQVVITSSDEVVCPGSQVQLLANTGTSDTFFWNDNLSGDTLRVVTVNSDTVFSATATSFQGCTSNLNVQVQVHNTPAPSLVIPDPVVCIGSGDYLLTGGFPAGGTYLGQGVTNNFLSTQSDSSEYRIITYNYTDTNGCVGAASDSLYLDFCTGTEEAKIMTVPQTLPQIKEWLEAHPPAVCKALYNSNGQTVFLSGSGLPFVSSVPAGLYLLEIHFRNQQQIIKILVP